MVTYRLHYFNARGRAELVRLIFAAADQQYEDIRIEREDWPQYKHRTPFGQLPYLEIIENGKVFQLAQSITIARYLARRFGLAGRTPEEEAEIESYGDLISDLMTELYKIRFERDEARKAENTKKTFEEILPNIFKNFENRISKNGTGYLSPSGLSWADLFLVNVLDWLGDKKSLILINYPNIKALDYKTRSNPKILEWIAKRPKTDL
nr:glutathione S-transferase sigma 1/4 [Brachionus rubens]